MSVVAFAAAAAAAVAAARRFRSIVAALLAGTLAVLGAACGGGGGGTSPPPPPADVTVQGTAAIGAALQSATVQFRCLTGSGQATTDASGNYVAQLKSVQFPCLLQASGGKAANAAAGAGNPETLVSLIAVTPVGAEFGNVTPLTHLLAARVLGSDPIQAFATCCGSAAQTARITPATVTAAQAQVREQIRTKMGLDVPATDWVRSAFSADPTNLMDQYLERLGAKRTELGRSLAQLSAELAVGTGELSLPNLPPGAIECNPGLIAGYSGAFDDKFSRVQRSVLDSIGGPGGDGNGADGGGVGGAEGQLINVEITVDVRDPIAGKTRFGPVLTDAVRGMVTFVSCGYAGPALFTARGGAGSLYYDEARGGSPVSFANQTLHVAVESMSKNVGITRLTEAAYVQMLQGAASADSPTPVLKAVAEPWHDVGRIALANGTVRAAINDQLPNAYRLEDITRLPVLLGPANASTAGVLTDTQNGVYGAVLAGLAKTGAAFQPRSTTPALTLGTQLVTDLSDGLLNQRNGAAPVAVRTDSQAYSYSSLSSALTINVGATAAQLGAGSLQTRRIPVQRVEAPVPGTANRWTFTLLSDGSVAVGRPPGSTAITVPPFAIGAAAAKRIGRLDVVQRSQLNFDSVQDTCNGQVGAAAAACTAANNWRYCLSALSADGITVFSWRVGLSAASYQSVGNAIFANEGTALNPIVSLSPASYDFGPQQGEMNAMALLQDGSFKSVAQCGLNDQHPGLARFASADATMSHQDGGNRYVLFSDGTLRVWGLNATAMGIGASLIAAANDPDRNSNGAGVVRPEVDSGCSPTDATRFCPGPRPVLDSAGGSGVLGDVVMVTSGGAAYQPRALVRAGKDPGTAGQVVVWGNGIAQPRPIPGLQGVCWIGGPYAVKCDGSVVYVQVSAAGGGISAVQTPVAAPVPIWRLREESVPMTVQREAAQLDRTFEAIARDGSVYRLSGVTLTKLADAP